jgi:hypothetical protein
METIISVCGDVCSECPRYIATLDDDNEKLEEIARLWHRLGFRDHIIGIEEIKCTGCNKRPDCIYRLTTCRHLTGKNNCGECELFPCSRFDEILRKLDTIEKASKQLCTPLEYRQLKKAFFNKKKILPNIHQSKFPK